MKQGDIKIGSTYRGQDGTLRQVVGGFGLRFDAISDDIRNWGVRYAPRKKDGQLRYCSVQTFAAWAVEEVRPTCANCATDPCPFILDVAGNPSPATCGRWTRQA